MCCKEILFSDHAITQMFSRNISLDSIKSVIENGEIINSYLYDKPYPSYLIFSYVKDRPIHIVLGKKDSLDRCIVITAYEPDKDIWEAGFKLKRK